MKSVLVVYATREGQTRRIAEHLGETVRARGQNPEIVDAVHIPSGFSLDRYSAVMAGASVQMGAHELEMVQFVKRHGTELGQMPSVFLSVSLSEAGAEDPMAARERGEQAAADVRRMMDQFLEETGWHPERIKARRDHFSKPSTTSSCGT